MVRIGAFLVCAVLAGSAAFADPAIIGAALPDLGVAGATRDRLVASLPVTAAHALVVTAQHLATQVGVDSLQQGGNAIDAAVAVGYALAVVEPCCGNIGGGGFMVVHLASGTNLFLDFQETAPLAATPGMFLDPIWHDAPRCRDGAGDPACDRRIGSECRRCANPCPACQGFCHRTGPLPTATPHWAIRPS